MITTTVRQGITGSGEAPTASAASGAEQTAASADHTAVEDVTPRENTPTPAKPSDESPTPRENTAKRTDRQNPPARHPKPGTKDETGSASASKNNDKSFDDAGGTGTTVGSRHAQGNIKNAPSVTHIKTKLANEAAAAKPGGSTAASISGEAA